MSRVLQHKVIYLSNNGRRYRYTEIIEVLEPFEPPTVATIDLTNDDTQNSNAQPTNHLPNTSHIQHGDTTPYFERSTPETRCFTPGLVCHCTPDIIYSPSSPSETINFDPNPRTPK